MKSDFAYCLYVTDPHYLCNAVMMLESLERVGTRASRVLLHPDTWSTQESTSTPTSKLLAEAQHLGATLQPIQLQHSTTGEPTWADSYTKLLAFNQTQFKRVISLDTDATVLQSLDELFLSPSTPVAAPIAYWLKDRTLSSQLMLIEPSDVEFLKIMDQIQHHKDTDFDMEIVNNLYGETATIIPHRPYDLLTGEFKAENHTLYLGDGKRTWNATRELQNAKFVHFSDWPIPKPWIASEDDIQSGKPPCRSDDDCRDQDAWLWMYRDFSLRKRRICDQIPER
ncbi:hypothetical protein KVT40_006547 [Elsinoe batatas]|uniref:Nucleotide-diphospho-sugar transferase n=1 Tax=Elsinoe batatas TaxID=2601811 RepID=A0A8K0PDW8_9PEZI|nr:hypothetical protein KVT40_006547 [Elsinoe batatas]